MGKDPLCLMYALWWHAFTSVFSTVKMSMQQERCGRICLAHVPRGHADCLIPVCSQLCHSLARHGSTRVGAVQQDVSAAVRLGDFAHASAPHPVHLGIATAGTEVRCIRWPHDVRDQMHVIYVFVLGWP